ncbi:hypothetical protein [Amycolatopsis sp. PS_44_ISF1]|uniref:hypothetical protein n=1 Tax=Amycolatopsis sp. PS_44_ISF1 TaxID=2974917 RepID=UPI0028E03A15|nr:hypothetical protein [Amycolatopsis sp. PS_44_ISF1]MDT8916054.1 hypothetical protein [Amycolatopsis sp. PS_44_ISF1]
MTDTRPNTVGDLIAALFGYDPATPLRIAAQPGYPMEHLVARVVHTPDDAESWGIRPTDPPVVWIGTGGQVGYLPAIAADALGWSA